MAAIRAEGRRSYTNLIIKIPPVGAASWPRFAPKDSVYARHGYSYSLVQTEIYAATGFILQALQANTPA